MNPYISASVWQSFDQDGRVKWEKISDNVKNNPQNFQLITKEGKNIIEHESAIIGTTSSTIMIYNQELKQTEIISRNEISKIIIGR